MSVYVSKYLLFHFSKKSAVTVIDLMAILNFSFTLPLLFLDRSSVMITPGGFINPSSYLETTETIHDVEKYTNFFTGRTNSNPGFKV